MREVWTDSIIECLYGQTSTELIRHPTRFAPSLPHISCEQATPTTTHSSHSTASPTSPSSSDECESEWMRSDRVILNTKRLVLVACISNRHGSIGWRACERLALLERKKTRADTSVQARRTRCMTLRCVSYARDGSRSQTQCIRLCDISKASLPQYEVTAVGS